MTEIELLNRFCDEKPFLEAWGNYLVIKISQILEANGYDVSDFLQIPACCRIKDDDSIVAKAFFRVDKQYDDPYGQITDKVGIRFVVLNISSLAIAKNIVESDAEWEYSKDVDFQQNRDDKPELFDYQSVHYIVRNRNPITFNDTVIPASTPCEIQIRTLLQHAYAEMSHQAVYKSVIRIEPDIRRMFAKSMAMIEVADDLFTEVQEAMNTNNIQYSSFITAAEEYLEFPRRVDTLNSEIFDAYKEFIASKSITSESLKAFIDNNEYILSKLKARFDESVIYQQPIILLLYYLIKEYTYVAEESWPYDESYIIPIMNDLGIAH